MWRKRKGTKVSEHLMLKVRDEGSEVVRVFWFWLWRLGLATLGFLEGEGEWLGFILRCRLRVSRLLRFRFRVWWDLGLGFGYWAVMADWAKGY